MAINIQTSIFRDYAFGSERSKVADAQTRAKYFRVLLVVLCVAVWVGILVFRLFNLQINDRVKWQDWALRQHFSELTLAPERAPILDRNGKTLAISVPASSVYVRKRSVHDLALLVKKLSSILSLEASQVEKKLQSTKPFIWILRQIPREKARELDELKLPGVGTVLEARRVYPYSQVASSLIGKVGIDGNGLSGIELLYENRLQGAGIVTRAAKDALGKRFQNAADNLQNFDLPKGKELKLTIDADISAIVAEEIEAAKKNYKAKAVYSVMLDADTGEILSLGQAPTLNFNAAESIDSLAFRNLAAELVFEPGSIFKPLVAAAALDRGIVRASDMIDCENGQFFYSTHTIKDVHPSGRISVSDVVVRSSNIGMTKIGLKMGAERLYKALKEFGFGRSSGLQLKGESSGIFRDYKTWAPIDVATHSYGQGIAVSALQIVRAFATLVNGGKLMPLKLLEQQEVAQPVQVLSANTVAQIREMLVGVVEDEHGTGQKAAVPGVLIGGKTGTAQKASDNGKGYQAGNYVSSFVGFADASALGIKTKLVLIVSVDEPRTDSIYGGVLAAPVFQRIIQRTVALLSSREKLG